MDGGGSRSTCVALVRSVSEMFFGRKRSRRNRARKAEKLQPRASASEGSMCQVPLLCCAAVTHGGSVFRPQLRPDTESCRTPSCGRVVAAVPCVSCIHGPRASQQPSLAQQPSAGQFCPHSAQATRPTLRPDPRVSVSANIKTNLHPVPVARMLAHETAPARHHWPISARVATAAQLLNTAALPRARTHPALDISLESVPTGRCVPLEFTGDKNTSAGRCPPSLPCRGSDWPAPRMRQWLAPPCRSAASSRGVQRAQTPATAGLPIAAPRTLQRRDGAGVPRHWAAFSLTCATHGDIDERQHGTATCHSTLTTSPAASRKPQAGHPLIPTPGCPGCSICSCDLSLPSALGEQPPTCPPKRTEGVPARPCGRV